MRSRLLCYLGWGLGGFYLLLNGALLRGGDRPEIFGVSALFALVFCYQQWEEPEQRIRFEPNGGAMGLGLLIGGWLLFKGWHLFSEDEAFLRCLPLLSLGSWGLICGGWQGLKQLGRYLCLFGFLAMPWELVYVMLDLSTLTAQFAHFLLWILGLAGERQGTLIRVGAGAIEVYHGCSGLKLILQLIGFTLLYFVLNSLRGWGQLVLIFGAIAIGFILNGMRVAMMAILVSLGDESAFAYWHLGTGSLIFSGLAVASLGCWGWLTQRWIGN